MRVLSSLMFLEDGGRDVKMGDKAARGPPPASFSIFSLNSPWQIQSIKYKTFFHHYQGSIDFNTVNIHRTVGMYFLVSTSNRGDIE